jgi:hypothetical protein
MLLIVYVVMFDSSRRSSRIRSKEGASLKEVMNKVKVSRLHLNLSVNGSL